MKYNKADTSETSSRIEVNQKSGFQNNGSGTDNRNYDETTFSREKSQHVILYKDTSQSKSPIDNAT